MAIYTNVMKWKLFASPEEVAGSGDFVAFIKDGREIYHVDSWQEMEKLVSNKNNGNTISQAY